MTRTFHHGLAAAAYRAEPRQRFLNSAELKSLGAVLGADGGPIHPYARQIVHLLALTGCRLGEIASLRWREVDFDNGCLRLSDTKTGQSMRAVGEPVLAILRSHARQVGSDFVFPASRGQGAYQGTKRLAKAVFEAAAARDATCYTLRHTFASVASELGYSDATIAGLLGHAGRGVTSRYVHRPDEALKIAANAVSQRIEDLMTAAATLPPPTAVVGEATSAEQEHQHEL